MQTFTTIHCNRFTLFATSRISLSRNELPFIEVVRSQLALPAIQTTCCFRNLIVGAGTGRTAEEKEAQRQ